MKTENLTKAMHSSEFLSAELRAAHTDAVNSGNQFAEIVLFDLIEASVELERKLNRAMEAADAMK